MSSLSFARTIREFGVQFRRKQSLYEQCLVYLICLRRCENLILKGVFVSNFNLVKFQRKYLNAENFAKPNKHLTTEHHPRYRGKRCCKMNGAK